MGTFEESAAGPVAQDPDVSPVSSRWDVAVVGASPAGLAAALHAAHAGVRVLLLEGKREIGVPPAPAALAFDFLWRAADRPPSNAVRRRLLGVRLRSPLAAAHSLEVAAPLSILDRTKLDQHLARLARDAGADVRTGIAALRVLPDRTLEWDDGGRARAGVVVFADGAGTLAYQFMKPTRDPHEIAWGAALTFDGPDAESDEFVTITPGSHAPGGRSQTNPIAGATWTHWTFSRGARAAQSAEEIARASLALECRLRGWDERETLANAELAAVAPDPVYALPRELVADGIMVVGGAAGQGGLEVGVASGELAGTIAAQAALSRRTDRATLMSYERAWKREWLGGYRALRRAADRLARLDDAALDKLLAPWSGWRVPVRDITGLAHPSMVRRAEALAKFAMRDPRAIPSAALLGLRAVLGPPRPTR